MTKQEKKELTNLTFTVPVPNNEKLPTTFKDLAVKKINT
jgi:hypothetical protein